MKIRTDIVRMYKDVHSWVGIVAGLMLFIAFYAGAITMFEEPLQRWASPATRLAPPVPLERAPELVAKALAAHPEAAKSYELRLSTDTANPARMRWTDATGEEAEHGGGAVRHAALAPDGTLQVESEGPSPVAQFVDVLHQQVGLAFLEHEVAMPIMGAVALLYCIAIVSGTVVLLPSLVSDLFALRVGKNLKRMWLDVHNVLGLFSLPFHLLMALTAVVFAFHDQFYDAQAAAFGRADSPPPRSAASPPGAVLSPAELVRRIEAQAPGFTPVTLGYSTRPDGSVGVRVGGVDPRYGLRGPTLGFATVDPFTGALQGVDYMPGKQDGWSAAITSFFALHFGNFGGATVRWAYVLLGLAGAMLFYTGNLLWVESRRKRERKAGAVEQTPATRVLGALTVGVSLGCVAGLSLTIAAAKPLAGRVEDLAAWHSGIYYAVFAAMVAWAQARGAAKGAVELLWASVAATLAIPLASLTFAGAGWDLSDGLYLVDLSAIALAATLALLARHTARRIRATPADSIWHAGASHAAPMRAAQISS